MLKFKIEGEPYLIEDFTSVGVYSKIYKIKDLFNDEYFAAKLINIVAGAPLEDLLECPYEEISYIKDYILSKLPTEQDTKFIDRFELDGIKYGFIPNWKDMTFAEFVDLDTLTSKKPEEILNNLHIIAAILYRPIIDEYSEHNFTIEKYNLETLAIRAEHFKKYLDVKYVIGAQFFFIKFATKLLNLTPQSLTLKLNWWDKIKMIWIMWRIILKIPSNKHLGGFWSSTKLLTMILQNTNISTRKK